MLIMDATYAISADLLYYNAYITILPICFFIFLQSIL